MIRTTQLTRRYGDLVAVDRLDLAVPQGAIFGFIGPNGAGKTTTINILATLLRPSSGRAWIDGIDIQADPREVRRRVGYMPESFGLYEDMLVWEYLDFFAAAYEVPARRRPGIVDDVLALTDLAPLRDRPLDSLSRGMRQRLCLAKTLVHDPKVLLLDEPASGLDPRGRIELRELLRTLAGMGKTILVSSHILSDLSSYCSHIGILEGGRLLAAGPVEEVLASVRAHRRIVLRCLREAGRAETLLAAASGVRNVVRDGNTLHFEFIGTDEELALLPPRLVEAAIPFHGLTERDLDLEEIFLELTTV